jgi:RimJ/RimL family protein N-acetyltransferase
MSLSIECGLWMFNNTPCQKIITNIPSFNRPAKLLALKCGMKQEGLITKTFMKNNQIYDVHLMGITKEEALCQQQ